MRAGDQLARLRDRVMDGARLERHHVVLDLRAGTGLLTWEAVRRVPEGGVWALAADEQAAEGLRQQSANLHELDRPHILVGEIGGLPELLHSGDGSREDLRFDAIVGRNALTHVPAEERLQWMRALADLAVPQARVCLAQIVPRYTQRICQLVELEALPSGLADRIRVAEEAIYARPEDTWVNWDVPDVEQALDEAGFESIVVETETQTADKLLTPALIGRWFDLLSQGSRSTYAQHMLNHISSDELDAYRGLIERTLSNQTVRWQSRLAFVVAMR